MSYIILDAGSKPKMYFVLKDLEALLEALHKSREENKALTNALESAENRCAKLTRDYERLVAKVQEEVSMRQYPLRSLNVTQTVACLVFSIFIYADLICEN